MGLERGGAEIWNLMSRTYLCISRWYDEQERIFGWMGNFIVLYGVEKTNLLLIALHCIVLLWRRKISLDDMVWIGDGGGYVYVDEDAFVDDDDDDDFVLIWIIGWIEWPLRLSDHVDWMNYWVDWSEDLGNCWVSMYRSGSNDADSILMDWTAVWNDRRSWDMIETVRILILKSMTELSSKSVGEGKENMDWWKLLVDILLGNEIWWWYDVMN